jgi:hypothetical protein
MKRPSLAAAPTMTIRQLEDSWVKKRIEFTREERNGWQKLIARTADIVMIFRPDGTFYEWRTVKQDALKSAAQS